MPGTTLKGPAIIVAFNLFMNAFNRLDQFRSTFATMRERVSLSLLTLVLDAININPHGFLNAIPSPADKIIDLYTIRQRIIWQWVTDYIECKQARKTSATSFRMQNENE